MTKLQRHVVILKKAPLTHARMCKDSDVSVLEAEAAALALKNEGLLELLKAVRGATLNLMTHRGYTGTIEVDLQNNCLFGRLLYINDLVNYEGSSVAELHSSFVVAIEDYLRLCTERGKNPDKPCSGTFDMGIWELYG